MHPKFLLTVVVILLTTPLWSSVGNVDIHEGNGEIERDTGDKFVTALDLEIFMSDTVKTGNGKTSLLFVDDTRVDVTQHSKLFIDEFVYYPATQEGQLNYLTSFSEEVKKSGGLGIVYWEPAWISTDCNSAWENATLFDFSGIPTLGIQFFSQD